MVAANYAYPDPHPLAGQTVKLKQSDPVGEPFKFTIEDWWVRVSGKSWMHCTGNPGCIQYAVRSSVEHLPLDDEVLYGKIGGLGYLVHVSELDT